MDLSPYLVSPLFHLENMRGLRDLLEGLFIREERAEDGQVVLEVGMATRDLLLVREGTLTAYAGEVAMARYERGMTAFLSLAATHRRSPWRYVAEGPLEYTLVPLQQLETHAELEGNLRTLLAEETEQVRDHIAVLLQGTTGKKLRYYLEREAKDRHRKSFTIAMNRNELAAYLGVVPTALYLEIKAAAKDGWLKAERNTYTLLR